MVIIAFIFGIIIFIGFGLLWYDYKIRIAERRMLSIITGEPEPRIAKEISQAKIRNNRVLRGRTELFIIRVFGIRPDVRGMNLVPWPTVLVVALPITYGIYVGAGIVVSPWLAILIALVAGYTFIRGVFAWETDRYRQKLFSQLPDVIELVISAVSAGMPVGAAFAQVARDVSPPTRDELSIVMADIGVGRPLDQAIMRIFERTRLAEYAILATTIGLQSDTGGRISESMENLGRIIRERQTVAERAKARASESKLSGNILAVMPIVFGVLMSAINPGYLAIFVTDPSATRLLVIAVALLAFGIVLMRFIIRWSLND